jgi:hypothetical protein
METLKLKNIVGEHEDLYYDFTSCLSEKIILADKLDNECILTMLELIQAILNSPSLIVTKDKDLLVFKNQLLSLERSLNDQLRIAINEPINLNAAKISELLKSLNESKDKIKSELTDLSGILRRQDRIIRLTKLLDTGIRVAINLFA